MEGSVDYLPIQYSQRDPSWKNERLGFSDNTIEKFGCLLTASATVLTHYNIPINPKNLNALLKRYNGFSGAYMYYQVLPDVYPVSVELMQCSNIEVPLSYIDTALEKGLLPIVEVDSNPKSGFQNHWIVIYKKNKNDYLVSDPWSLDPHSELVSLSSRFGFAGSIKKIIKNIFLITPNPGVYTPIIFNEDADQDVGNQTPIDNNESAVTPTNEGSTDDLISLILNPIPTGNKLKTIIDGLRVRTGPSLDSKVLTMVPNGTEFVSAGDQVHTGNIVWQPVLLYVAVNCMNERYIVPVE